MNLKITLTGERPAGQTPGYFDPSMTTPVAASVDLDTDNVTAIAETAETFLVRELGIEELPGAAALRQTLTETAAEVDRVTGNLEQVTRRQTQAVELCADHGEHLALALELLGQAEGLVAGSAVRRPAGFTRKLKAFRAYAGKLIIE